MENDPIEELLLRAYPNPERKGCPGSEILQALGVAAHLEVLAMLFGIQGTS